MGMGNKPNMPSYQSTTSSNPYASATVNNDGTSYYQLNDFLTNMNTAVENILPSLYAQLISPNLDNAVTKSRLNAFSDTLNSESYKQFENNLSALSQRGILRSSAVNDMTNKLSEYQTDQIAKYANNLISNNTSDVTSLLNTFLNQYLLGANLGTTTLSNALNANQLLNNFNLSTYQQLMQAYNKSNNFANGMNLISSLAGSWLGSLLGESNHKGGAL